MKKFLISLITLTILFISGNTFAGTISSKGNTAVIPHFYSYDYTSYYYKTFLYFTNITDDTITVTLTLYDSDGTLISDDDSSTAGDIIGENFVSGTYDETLTSETMSFNIASGKTVILKFQHSDYTLMYGMVEWSQTGSGHGRHGLLASGSEMFDHFTNHKRYRRNIDINGNKPF